METKISWLIKKKTRSVDELRLWDGNPRLDPENDYIKIKEYTNEIISDEAKRKNFLELLRSIATNGYLPIDPIIVWQNKKNKKFYVAEGNRRILALKLLRNPDKSPKSIMQTVKKLSKDIDRDSFEKVHVHVAPDFETTEWYITQRHSTASLQKPWEREAHQRWISQLYDKYDGDIDQIKLITMLTESELYGIIRILKLKDLIHEIKNDLDPITYKRAYSQSFPISTFERFFNNKAVKEHFHLQFNEGNFIINAERQSFLKAFSAFITRMMLPEGDKNRIDSRTGRTSELIINKILPSLPVVSKSNSSWHSTDKSKKNAVTMPSTSKASSDKSTNNTAKTIIKNNPDRPKLISPNYHLNTDDYRLLKLFNELKKIPTRSYPNAVSASIRVFLDLTVKIYISNLNLESKLQKKHKLALRDITLKKRIDFLKDNISTKKVQTILLKLLNPENDFSLDVLNGYIHNQDTHFLSMNFLNRFWDFLFPFFNEVLDIKESKE
jgi:ParB-like nuclease domain.